MLHFQTVTHKKLRDSHPVKAFKPPLLFRHGAGSLIHAAGLTVIIKCFQWCNAGLDQAIVPQSTNKIHWTQKKNKKPGLFLAEQTHTVRNETQKGMTERASLWGVSLCPRKVLKNLRKAHKHGKKFKVWPAALLFSKTLLYQSLNCGLGIPAVSCTKCLRV